MGFTIYDLDETRSGKGKSSVTLCGDAAAPQARLTPNSVLATSSEGKCTTVSSTMNGKHNPTDPYDLTPVQASMVSTFELKKKSFFELTFEIEKGPGGRNFLFAMIPVVSCLQPPAVT